MKKKFDLKFLLLLMPVLYLFTAIVVVVLVSQSGVYPSGSDTMYHIYRGDYVYQSIKEGNWFPLLNPMWYNGVELMRYWAPLPAYFMALCQFLAGGNALNGYLIFVGMICFLGALPWLVIGKRLNRPWLGAIFGLLWFFMPNNLLALFEEGNLARSLCMVFLPIFIFGVIEYLHERRWSYLPLVTISFACMAMCHLGYAGMIVLGMLVYFVVYMIQFKQKKPVGELLIAILLGFVILGLWVYPSLNGGITSMDSSENMKNFFQSAWTSLNPLERFESNNGNFYFGLASFIIAVVGILCSYKKAATGFFTAIIIFICTTSSMYVVLKLLPGSQYLWMLRFISIALCLILYSFLKWNTLRKPLVALFVILLIADTIPSLSLIYGYENGESATERLDSQQENTLIAEAQSITEQRLALMDESSMGATGAWLVSNWNQSVAGTFGAGWEASNTATNIVQLNKALTNGNFYYLFDRCLELGNDTVLIQLSQIDTTDDSVDVLDQAAMESGYELVDSNSDYRLYHMDMEGNWGTVNTYDAIGIGSSAASISLYYPAMEETESTNLNDYTFEELSQYQLVCLAGFTYDDKDAAEELIIKLSEAGVHIVIAADDMPQDKKTHEQSFLGVTCNTITFSNGYPLLETTDGILSTDLFPQGYTSWQTVYLEGLDESLGMLYDNDISLDFYGTVENENIVMIGLNLMKFYGLTNDSGVGALLNEAMTIQETDLPEREIVPLTIQYDANEITITTSQNDVNTTIAYHDIFSSDQDLYETNNLTVVNKGTTTIKISYPYFWTGLGISISGILLSVVYFVLMKKRLMHKSENPSNKNTVKN